MKVKKLLCIVMSVILLVLCTSSVYAENYPYNATYKINENGESYGTDAQSLLVGYEADLILAVGENGFVGYVRSTDLDDGIDSPTEVQSSNTADTVKYIPLYSSDGETIIDRFAILLNVQEKVSTRAIVEYSYGDDGSVKTSEYTCSFASAIADCTNGVRGKTTIWFKGKVDAKWIGVQARVYRASDDALVAFSPYKYNSTDSSPFEYNVYHFTIKTYEAYYSQGIVRTWCPSISEYVTTKSSRSPNINPTIRNP